MKISKIFDKRNRKVSGNEERWFKLDNAALIYPSAANNSWNSVFRVSAILKEEVNPVLFQQALDTAMKRFPHFNVCLKKGFFWYYFQQVFTNPVIEKEQNYPCRKIEFGNGKFLFRVLYFGKKVSFESFHSLTDGVGAICFLNTLLAKYFSLQEKPFDDKKLQISYKDKPTEEEIEDSFNRYADLKKTNSRKGKTAYQFHGTPEERGKLNVITGVLKVDELKTIAKQHSATVTEFLVGVYLKAILEGQQGFMFNKRPVVISVPVNLRQFFPSETLRNFSSWINVTATKQQEEFSLEKLIELAKEEMKNANPEYLMKNVNANVLAQKNFFVRTMPLAIKNLALKFSYSTFGEKLYTTALTNLGQVKTPPEFINYIERYDCILGAGWVNNIGCAVISFNNNLSITLTSKIKEKYLERKFFRILSGLGLSIYLETNIK